MEVRLDPRTSARQMEAALLKEVAYALNLALRQAAPAIRTRIGEACDGLVRRTPEYLSLLGGKLMEDFGLPDAEHRIDQILDEVKRGAFVEVIPVTHSGGRLSGGMRVGLFRENFEDILALGAASYVSAPSGETVPWLDWLLLQGDRIIVYTHRVDTDLDAAQKARSRTGRALMLRPGVWHVPSEFAGTLQDNFLLRAFDAPGVEEMLLRVFREEITRRF